MRLLALPTRDSISSCVGAGAGPSLTDWTWQNFRLTAASSLAIDKGTSLPASLVALLAKFGIDGGQKGAALDLGAIEFDPDNPNTPLVIDVGPRDGGASEAVPPWPIPTAGDGGVWTNPGSGSGKSSGCGYSLAGKNEPTGWGWWWVLGLARTLHQLRLG